MSQKCEQFSYELFVCDFLGCYDKKLKNGTKTITSCSITTCSIRKGVRKDVRMLCTGVRKDVRHLVVSPHPVQVFMKIVVIYVYCYRINNEINMYG